MARSTDAATAAHIHNATLRALDDPVQLAKAARIIRAALARKKIRVDELTPAVDADADADAATNKPPPPVESATETA